MCIISTGRNERGVCTGWGVLRWRSQGRFEGFGQSKGAISLISGDMMVLLSKGGLGSCFVCVARVFVGSRKYKLECCHSVTVPNLTLANCHSNDNSSCQLENCIVLSPPLVL